MTKPVSLCLPIYQGQTFDEVLSRVMYPYAVREECGVLVRVDTGQPAHEADATPEDYTGCSARMQLRASVDSPDVISEISTDDGGIVLSGKDLRIRWSAAATSAMADLAQPVGHVEVTRPNGDVERQYEITFPFSPEVTR